MDISIRECCFDDIPTIISRLVADTGGSIVGRDAHVGSVFWMFGSLS